MKRMLMGICLAICMVCGVVEARADCSGIDDPYLKAKCEVEGQKASGLVGAGILAPNMTKVPQYSGSPGCVTAGCSGAAEEKYYDDPGSLSAAGGAAGQGAQSCAKFRQCKWFDQIVVRATIQSANPVVDRVAGCQQQYRGVVAGTATFGQYFQPGLAWQVDVENCGIVAFATHGQLSSLAIAHPVNGVAGLLQSGFDAVSQ